MLLLLPLLTAVSVSAICQVLPESYYTITLESDWRYPEKTVKHKIEFDFDNDNKFQDFVVNDETYVLVRLTGQGIYSHSSVIVYHPVNEPGSSSSNGCLGCTGWLHSGQYGALPNADGYGWISEKTIWFELEDVESGRDLNSGSEGSQYLEFDIVDIAASIETTCSGCFNHIKICQAVSPTITGYSPGNVAISQNSSIPLSAVEGENVHYTAITRQTKTLQMAFSGTHAVDTNSYIQAGFDGELAESSIFSPMASMDREDLSMNVYNFHFDGEYCVYESCTAANEWYMNFMITYTGSDWHAPKVQWISLVNPAESQAPPTVAPTTSDGMNLAILYYICFSKGPEKFKVAEIV